MLFFQFLGLSFGQLLAFHGLFKLNSLLVLLGVASSFLEELNDVRMLGGGVLFKGLEYFCLHFAVY